MSDDLNNQEPIKAKFEQTEIGKQNSGTEKEESIINDVSDTKCRKMKFFQKWLCHKDAFSIMGITCIVTNAVFFIVMIVFIAGSMSAQSERITALENQVSYTTAAVDKLDEDLLNFIDHATISVVGAENESHGYLGVQVMTVTEEMHDTYGFPYGVYVADVISGGGAYNAAMADGDIIVAINGESVSTSEELVSKMTQCEMGDVVKVDMFRADQGVYTSRRIMVTLGANPEETASIVLPDLQNADNVLDVLPDGIQADIDVQE